MYDPFQAPVLHFPRDGSSVASGASMDALGSMVDTLAAPSEQDNDWESSEREATSVIGPEPGTNAPHQTYGSVAGSGTTVLSVPRTTTNRQVYRWEVDHTCLGMKFGRTGDGSLVITNVAHDSRAFELQVQSGWIVRAVTHYDSRNALVVGRMGSGESASEGYDEVRKLLDLRPIEIWFDPSSFANDDN